MSKPICVIEGCQRVSRTFAGLGLCEAHYAMKRKRGSPTAYLPKKSPEERFWEKVERKSDSECWPWIGATANGYGHLQFLGKTSNAHRVAYILTHGEASAESHIDHLCRNPICVNPAHLEEVTPRVNWERGFSPWRKRSLQTHCLRGHPFNEENTYFSKSRGVRICRTCHRDYMREKWRKDHAATSRDNEISAG